jgi:hypothetical protein
MKFINYGGETVALCLALPNWQANLKVTIDLSEIVNITDALSAKETRERFGKSGRYHFEYEILTGDAAHTNAVRLWLQRLKGETVAVPLWTDGVEIYSAAAIAATVINKTPDNPVQYGSEWIIVNQDASVYEIVTVNSVDLLHVNLAAGTTLAWPAGTMMFPLLFGLVAERPKIKAETDEIISGTISFDENSTYARRLNPYAAAIPVVGASIAAFSTKPLFNIRPQFVDPIDTTEVDILESHIGFLRQRQRQVYPQAVRRGLEFNFLQDSRDNIAAITRFWMDRFGPVKTFMVPTFMGNLRLTQDLPVGAGGGVFIYVEMDQSFIDAFAAAVPGMPYIALVDGHSVDPQKIDIVDGTQLTLHSAVTQTHSMADTDVSHLVLGRFAESKLTWTYTTDGLAETKLKVIETPDEYAAPQADRPERAFLFRFREDLPNGSSVFWYFTSYENNLVLAGTAFDGNYVPGPFDHGDVTAGTDMEEEKLEITSFDFSSTANPLRRLLEFSLEGILRVDVLEVDVNNLAAAPTVVFSGDSSGLDPTGKEWTATFLAFGQFFRRQFPRYYVQRICNVPVYSPKCGLNRATFLTDGTLYAIAVDGSYIDIAAIVAHTDPATKPAHWFDGPPGYFETGAGVNYEQRTITQASVVSGKLRLFFSKPLRKAVLNQVVNMYPGCNGTIGMCISRFNNQVNHRGMAWIPDKDPTTNADRVDIATGGKK